MRLGDLGNLKEDRVAGLTADNAEDADELREPDSPGARDHYSAMKLIKDRIAAIGLRTKNRILSDNLEAKTPSELLEAERARPSGKTSARTIDEGDGPFRPEEKIPQTVERVILHIGEEKPSPRWKAGSEIIFDEATLASWKLEEETIATYRREAEEEEIARETEALTRNTKTKALHFNPEGNIAETSVASSATQAPLLQTEYTTVVKPLGLCWIAFVDESKSALNALLSISSEKDISDTRDEIPRFVEALFLYFALGQSIVYDHKSSELDKAFVEDVAEAFSQLTDEEFERQTRARYDIIWSYYNEPKHIEKKQEN